MSYVEQLEGAYRIAGTRVWLDSIVRAYVNGQTAKSIAQSFPALTLEQVHGALAFYLAHQSDVNASLERAETEYDALRKASRRQHPMFYQKLARARQAQQSA
jgi:uncharacterized protein (DUF433 family)